MDNTEHPHHNSLETYCNTDLYLLDILPANNTQTWTRTLHQDPGRKLTAIYYKIQFPF